MPIIIDNTEWNGTGLPPRRFCLARRNEKLSEVAP
jgi:hypothetical protein